MRLYFFRKYFLNSFYDHYSFFSLIVLPGVCTHATETTSTFRQSDSGIFHVFIAKLYRVQVKRKKRGREHVRMKRGYLTTYSIITSSRANVATMEISKVQLCIFRLCISYDLFFRDIFFCLYYLYIASTVNGRVGNTNKSFLYFRYLSFKIITVKRNYLKLKIY